MPSVQSYISHNDSVTPDGISNFDNQTMLYRPLSFQLSFKTYILQLYIPWYLVQFYCVEIFADGKAESFLKTYHPSPKGWHLEEWWLNIRIFYLTQPGSWKVLALFSSIYFCYQIIYAVSPTLFVPLGGAI